MDDAGMAMIAALIGLGAYRANPVNVLRACGYLQGGVLLLLGLVTHFMGMDVAGLCVAGAGACYFLGAAGVRRRGLFAAAALLFLSGFGQVLLAEPGRVNPVFAFQQCGLALGLVGLAAVLAGNAPARTGDLA